MDDNTVIRFPNDNTIVRPTPGGKRLVNGKNMHDRTRINFPGGTNSEQNRAHQSPALSYQSEPLRHFETDAFNHNYQCALNDLLLSAAHIISILIKLSESILNEDINQLKYKLQDEIKQYELNASAAGIANEKILQARYVLCTTLDEIIVSTPWGRDSDWSNQSLLSIFHGETWGGEKFFLLLDRLQKEPVKNLDILELMYVLLSLGFQGKFRVIENGRGEVESLREDLYRQLRSLKKDFKRELSLNWHGISDPRGVLIRYVPLWVVAALSCVILLAIFASFTYMLNQSATPVMQQISALGNNTLAVSESINRKGLDSNKAGHNTDSRISESDNILQSEHSAENKKIRMVKPQAHHQREVLRIYDTYSDKRILSLLVSVDGRRFI